MTSPFKESLLVPASFLIKRKKKKIEKNAATTILSNKKIPADVRIKYFDNFVRFNKEKTSPPMKVITQTEEEKKKPEYDVETLLREIPDNKLPLARAILEYIAKSKEITWDRKFQLVIDGREIRNSDIRELMKYLVGLSIVTKEEDIPIGGNELVHKLELIDLPWDWLKHIPKIRQTRKRTVKKQEQKGEGKGWITY